MRTRQKQRIIIGTLCAVIVGLAVGYAVLSQTLNINGTGGITSDFNIVFTDIQEGMMNGATTVNKQITSSTTATFTIDLKSPGSNGEYNITVENRGNIDAYVESIKGLDEANSTEPTDVKFSIEGIKVNDKLPATESKVFKVKVNWDSSSTNIPSSNKDLTLTINFAQDNGESGGGSEGLGNAVEYLLNNKLEDTVETRGNGFVALDDNGEITTSSSPREYRYIGPDPDNYIQFNNELWRIIGIFDGQLKIVRNEATGPIAFNTAGNNNWSTSSLQTYLNGEYYNTIDSNDQSKIDTYTWKLGGSSSDTDATAQMFYERERGTYVTEGYPTEWEGKIALPYASDFGFATSGGESTYDRNGCLTIRLHVFNSDKCTNNSWLRYNSNGSGSYAYWVLTAFPVMSTVQFLGSDGNVSTTYANSTSEVDVRPALYLLSDVEFLSGSGTSEDPYILK